MDNIKFELDLIGKKSRYLLKNNDFIDGKKNNTKIFDWGNVRFTFNSISKKLIVSGSIHKLCKGNNYTSFNRSDIKNIILEMSDKIGIDPETEKINFLYMEYGINAITKTAPIELVNRFISYKRNEYLYYPPKKRTTKLWGKVCYSSTGKIKVYDKKLETILQADHYEIPNLKKEIPDNLLRYEVVYEKPKTIPLLKNLSSLYDLALIEYMNKDLIEKLKNSIFTPFVEWELLSPKQAKLIYAWQSKEYRDFLKTKHINTYYDNKKEYDYICKSMMTGKDPIKLLHDKIEANLRDRILK